MTRWLPPVALAAVVVLLAVVAVVVIRPGPTPNDAERAEALAAELRCPDCQGLSVADSPTTAAAEMRRQIDDLLAAGASDADVRAHFTARFGTWILLAPASPVPWVIPFAAVAFGVSLLGWWLLRRRGGAPAPARTPALSEADRRRLHEEADALDA